MRNGWTHRLIGGPAITTVCNRHISRMVNGIYRLVRIWSDKLSKDADVTEGEQLLYLVGGVVVIGEYRNLAFRITTPVAEDGLSCAVLVQDTNS